MATLMHPKDAVYGSMAECYFTLDGRRMNFMSVSEFEAKYEVNLTDVPILGKVGFGHKSAGGKVTWSGTAHFNQSALRNLMKKYQETGAMQYFEIQVTNEDPTSAVGRQTIILKDCLMDSVVLTKFAAGEDLLDEEISGTAESWLMPEEFTELPGT